MKILLDYFFPITSIEPTAAASTAFLKQVLIVVRPDDDVDTGVITLCTTMAQVAALTENTEAQQLFNAGMGRVYVLPMDDLDLAAALEGFESDFFTILISSDFSDSDIQNLVTTAAVASSLKVQDVLFTAETPGIAGDSITITYVDDGTAGAETVDVSGTDITVHMEDGASTAENIADAVNADDEANDLVGALVDEGDEDDKQVAAAQAPLDGGVDEVVGDPDAGLLLGQFKGVVGVSSTDDTFLAAQAAISKRAAFHTKAANKAKNMFFAFGSLLSNALSWRNQQYITMPVADDVVSLGSANALFDSKISFVISDDEFGQRLALFAAGAKAIVAPYILRNLQIDMQSAALTYISGNQPAFTKTQAALVEDELQKVIQSYVDRQWITEGTVAVTLVQDNFVASGAINVAEPKALWRIAAEMLQTL